ncbi:hypothetical protein [Aureimonas sp. SK2]|uniref:hypothetical protein n=1 Tax=Aureimonas sp. SK2 TaxID=3015992 RepID=UPI0024440E3F|nr:hypothetical protein [Aureimonas sp. SK2]
MSDTGNHKRLEAQIVREGAEALRAYIARCKRMSPESFAREPRSATSRLSAAQYAEIVVAITGIDLPRPMADAVQEKPVAAMSPRRPITKWWRSLSNAKVSVILGGAAAIIASVGFSFGAIETHTPDPMVRSRSTGEWGSCRRLSPEADGCLYSVRTSMPWARAAALLDQPEAMLRLMNKHLPAAHNPNLYIPQGARLIIWRSTGKLKD